MKLQPIAIAIVLAGMASVSVAAQSPHVGSFAASAAQASVKPQLNLVWGFGAERIVGAYQSDAQVRKCGSTFTYIPVTSTISFQSGGTVTESARFPPAGAYNAFGIPGLFTRNIGQGTWWYNPFTRTYSVSLRYDYFIDGVFHGVGTVDRDVKMSADGNSVTGPVQSSIFAADGSLIVDVCGDATSTRL